MFLQLLMLLFLSHSFIDMYSKPCTHTKDLSPLYNGVVLFITDGFHNYVHIIKWLSA